MRFAIPSSRYCILGFQSNEAVLAIVMWFLISLSRCIESLTLLTALFNYVINNNKIECPHTLSRLMDIVAEIRLAQSGNESKLARSPLHYHIKCFLENNNFTTFRNAKARCHKGSVARANRIGRPIKVLPEVRMPSG